MFNRLLSITLAIAVFLIVLASGNAVLAQEQISVDPVFKEVRANTIYAVKFTATKAIPADAQFIVTFPKVFDISNVKIAGSSTINGGFVTTVKDSVVTITRSGIGRIIPSGEEVDLQFATVRNPYDADSYEINISIKAKNGNMIAQKSNSVKITQKTEQK